MRAPDEHVPSAPLSAEDERANVLLAAGGVLASMVTPVRVWSAPETDPEGNPTGKILVRFHFLKSTYRISIERVPGSEVD